MGNGSLSGHDARGSLGDVSSNTEYPHLVAPTPVYANPSPLTHYDSNRSGQSGSLVEQAAGEGEEQQPKQTSSSRPSSSLRALADPNAILPVRGNDECALAALEKLERMKKATQTKRRWMKRSGAEEIVVAATAGGKSQVKPMNGTEKEETMGVELEGESKGRSGVGSQVTRRQRDRGKRDEARKCPDRSPLNARRRTDVFLASSLGPKETGSSKQMPSPLPLSTLLRRDRRIMLRQLESCWPARRRRWQGFWKDQRWQ